MKNPSKKGSALIITIFITMILMLIGLYLLEKIIPVARSVKNIESSNVAYYQAQSGVEKALLQINPLSPLSTDVTISSGSAWSSTINASGQRIPLAGQGNSEYDFTKSWNRLAIGQPIQLKLPANIDWSVAKFYFRVPDLDGSGISTFTLSGATNFPYVSWILSGSGDSLYASGSQIGQQAISNGTLWTFSVASGGVKLDGAGDNFVGFYGAHCVTDLKCSLKLGVINPLILDTDNKAIPYLEYQIDFGVGKSVPQQYAVITADGFAGGFKQTIQRQAQQLTTNEALDFTIFQ